jgi:ABC-type transporter MlaC component
VTQLLRPGGQRAVDFDWTVIRHGARCRIVDLSIHGVSQALTDRAEFIDLMARSRGPLAALVGDMRAETANLNG